MQWIVFILSSIILVTARTKIDNREDFELGSLETQNLFEAEGKHLWNPQYPRNLFEIFNNMNEKKDISNTKVPKKRALSALSRWKPLGNLGVRIKSAHRVPSRAPMMSMLPEMNLISAESSEGVRPLGQPLRWGRKR